MTYGKRKITYVSLAAIFAIAAALFCAMLFQTRAHTAQAANTVSTVYWGVNSKNDEYELIIHDDQTQIETVKGNFRISDSFMAANEVPWIKLKDTEPDVYNKITSALVTGGYHELSNPAGAQDVNWRPTMMSYWFAGMSQLKFVDISYIEQTTDMGNLFSGCTGLVGTVGAEGTAVKLGNTRIESLMCFNGMFKDCKNITEIDLSSIYVPQDQQLLLKWTQDMFSGCANLKSINFGEAFKTNDFNKHNAARMFQNCSSLTSLDLSNFDFSKISSTTNAANMFGGCDALKTIIAPEKIGSYALPLPVNYYCADVNGGGDTKNITTDFASTAAKKTTLTRHETHSGGNATCIDKAACEICGQEYGELGAHSYGEWETTEEPTCSQPGSKKKTCADCNDVQTEPIEINPNAHSYGEWTETKKATCTEKGEEQRVCANDDTHKETREVAAIGHSFGEWAETKKATCTEKGEEQRVCANDDTHKETREVAATGHSFGEWTETKKATCTEKGEEQRVCANDDTHKDTREVAATGHSFGEFIAEVPATETENGTKAHKDCTVCEKHFDAEDNEITDLIIPATGAHPSEKYTVTVTGGDIEGTQQHSVSVNKDATVTIVAAKVDGKTFKGWRVNNGETIVSTEDVYTFHVNENMNIIAVYENTDATEQDGKTLPTGAIVGISIGGGLLLPLIIYIVMYFALYRRGKLKGKFWDVIYVPMDALFGKNTDGEKNS